MEGDPFFDDGLEYLFGFIYLNYKNQDHFKSFWATDRSSEKQAFEQFIDFVIARLQRFPDLHVYHYAPYEATAIKRLMGLHGTREEEVDRLLRGQVLVDLYMVVRQGLSWLRVKLRRPACSATGFVGLPDETQRSPQLVHSTCPGR
jgi:predicted RecB family nuclease